MRKYIGVAFSENPQETAQKAALHSQERIPVVVFEIVDPTGFVCFLTEKVYVRLNGQTKNIEDRLKLVFEGMGGGNCPTKVFAPIKLPSTPATEVLTIAQKIVLIQRYSVLVFTSNKLDVQKVARTIDKLSRLS